jgi:uncharacterized protein (TIGR04255 family)
MSMADSTKTKGQFDPVHDAHAIEQVVFVLQVDRPLEDQTFVEAREAAAQFIIDLPGRTELQGMGLMIGAVGIGSPAPPIMGTVFSRTNPAGIVESELRIERMTVTFRTTLYTRWDAVWAQARKYFDVLVPKYVTTARVTGISLNFVDRFVWTGPIAECRPVLLLRPSSKYVTPAVYEAPDLWHSHTGAFLRADKQTKRLLNVNIDYVDGVPPSKKRTVVITTVLNDMFNQPNYEATEVTEKSAAALFDAHMQQMHSFGKNVFGNIINDEMKKRIALVD